MSAILNLQVNQINLGNLKTLQALEAFFYAGSDLSALLAAEKENFTPPTLVGEEGLWVVNPAFQRIFMKNQISDIHVIPESTNWLLSAFQACEPHSGQLIHLAAADERGNYVTCRITPGLPPDEFFTSIRLLEFDARKQAVFSAKKQSGIVAILDCDTGREYGDIEQFLKTSGIAHSPVIAANAMPTASALTNLIQLVQMAFSIEYRTLYTNGNQEHNLNLLRRSKPWFTGGQTTQRSGLLLSLSSPDRAIEIKEPIRPLRKINRKHYLLTVSGDDETELLTQLDRLIAQIQEGNSLSVIEKNTHLANNADKKYRVCLVAPEPEALLAEIKTAQKGIPSAVQSGKEWHSRGGSYFTPQPLGEHASIAFVYPGAFNSYIGMGAELLHCFPFLHDWLSEHNENPQEIYQAENLFPPEWGSASDEQVEQMQLNLLNSPLSMLFSGTAIAGMYTHLLETVFGISPEAAYGYSLGEIMMFFATGFWQQTSQIKREITQSDLYKNRIAGSMDAVHEFWGRLGLEYKENGNIWENMILMTNVEKVKEAVAEEPLVYLTHINTHRQVVIGGEPQSCQRVVESLRCMRFPIPVNYPMHCAPVASEFETLRDLNLQPVEQQVPLRFYSSFSRAPYPAESSAIAQTVAGGLVNRVDFNALTQRVYDDGYQIFIEVGARSNCSKWIERSLKSKQFCVASVNQAEIADEVCLMKVIARLVSHGKKVTLPVN